jgi:hypothetical protein
MCVCGRETGSKAACGDQCAMERVLCSKCWLPGTNTVTVTSGGWAAATPFTITTNHWPSYCGCAGATCLRHFTSSWRVRATVLTGPSGEGLSP